MTERLSYKKEHEALIVNLEGIEGLLTILKFKFSLRESFQLASMFLFMKYGLSSAFIFLHLLFIKYGCFSK